jgi:hypothetical protein
MSSEQGVIVEKVKFCSTHKLSTPPHHASAGTCHAQCDGEHANGQLVAIINKDFLRNFGFRLPLSSP